MPTNTNFQLHSYANSFILHSIKACLFHSPISRHNLYTSIDTIHPSEILSSVLHYIYVKIYFQPRDVQEAQQGKAMLSILLYTVGKAMSMLTSWHAILYFLICL